MFFFQLISGFNYEIYLFPKNEIDFFQKKNIIIFSNQHSNPDLFFNIKNLSKKYSRIIYEDYNICTPCHQLLKINDSCDIKINPSILFFEKAKLRTKHIVSIQKIFNLKITSYNLEYLEKFKFITIKNVCLAIIDNCWNEHIFNISSLSYTCLILYYDNNLHDILLNRQSIYYNISFTIKLKNYILELKSV